jgi:hypothetical protein
MRAGRHANIKPSSHTWIGSGSGIGGLGFNLVVKQESSKAELYIDPGDHDEKQIDFRPPFSKPTCD